MATYLTKYRRYNGSGFDDIVFETPIEAVAGLQDALDGKENTITKGNVGQYFRGDMSLATFPSSLPASDVQDWAKSSQALTSDMYLKVKENSASWVNASGLASDLGLGSLAYLSGLDLGDLSSVELSSPSTGQILTYTALGNWQALNKPSYNASEIGGLGVNYRWLTDGHISTWNAKQSAITGGATSITSSNLTINRALVSDSAGKVIVSGITSTELGRLSGVDDNIQDQIDGLVSTKLDDPEGSASQYIKGDGTLANFPSIPSVNNPTITLSGGSGIGVTLGAFTLNQTSNQLITITNSSPNANHTGDVTGSGALTIANDVVTNAKLANMVTARIKGRFTAGTGDPEDLTQTQVRTFLGLGSAAYAATTAFRSSSWPGGTAGQYVRGDGSLLAFPSIPSSLGNLSDVDLTLPSPANGHILTFNGVSWKAATKPTYNLDEISEGTTYKRVTQSEKNTWNNGLKLELIRSRSGTTALTVYNNTAIQGLGLQLSRGDTIMFEVLHTSTITSATPKVITATIGSIANSTSHERSITYTTWSGSEQRVYSMSVALISNSLTFGNANYMRIYKSGSDMIISNSTWTPYIGKVWKVVGV